MVSSDTIEQMRVDLKEAWERDSPSDYHHMEIVYFKQWTVEDDKGSSIGIMKHLKFAPPFNEEEMLCKRIVINKYAKYLAAFIPESFGNWKAHVMYYDISELASNLIQEIIVGLHDGSITDFRLDQMFFQTGAPLHDVVIGFLELLKNEWIGIKYNEYMKESVLFVDWYLLNNKLSEGFKINVDTSSEQLLRKD